MTATSEPPFKIPLEWRLKAPNGWQEKKVTKHSDGDSQRWPSQPPYRPSDEANYLIRLATDWAGREGNQQAGIGYYLDALPKGYACFEQEQPGGPQVYKRLFGHPSGRFYDSIIKFETHFFWLVDRMHGKCNCVLCAKDKDKIVAPRTRKPRDPANQALHIQRRVQGEGDSDSEFARSDFATGIAIDRVRRKGRLAHAHDFVDDEGVPDIWKDCIRRTLHNRDPDHGIEVDIMETESIDWEAERYLLPSYLTQIEHQHSFVPRLGELVLWIPLFIEGLHLLRHPETDEFQLYSFEEKSFLGRPPWRGGVVAAVPNASSQNGTIDFRDILDTVEKRTSLNTAGFRIETMPDSNNDEDKSLSKQYRYVPLQNIRPLSHWQTLLKGIPQHRLHPSILYAMTCMTSISLLGKWRFKGDWPNGVIFARGVYLGPELITVGDAIRLKPRSSSKDEVQYPDVLVVESIRLYLQNCQPFHATADSKSLCTTSWIAFTGTGYTLNVNRALRNSRIDVEAVKQEFRPVGTDEYGSWYPVHDIETQRHQVSHDQVLGRMYEADAVRLWTGQRQDPTTTLGGRQKPLSPPDLFFDAAGILSARKYATLTDARLPEPSDAINSTDGPFSWYFADSRGQGLSITSLNGIELGWCHSIRTPATVRTWNANLQIAKGKRVDESILQDLHPDKWEKGVDGFVTYKGNSRGRLPGSKVVDGRLLTAETLTGKTGPSKGLSNMTPKDGDHISSEIAGVGVVDNMTPSGKQNSTPRSSQQHSSSQMAGAALVEIDEDDSDERLAMIQTENEDEDNEPFPRSMSRSQTVQNSVSVETERVNVEHKDQVSDKIEVKGIGQQRVSREPGSNSINPARSTVVLNNVNEEQEDESDEASDDYEGEDVYDELHKNTFAEEDEIDEDWTDPRYARGGTEESEGGDYRP